MFAAPGSTSFPLLTLFDVQVRVSPWYLLLVGYLAWGIPDTALAVILALGITASLLVHEFGHALVARRFHLGPSIMLHGFGGYCLHQHALTDRDEALVVAAGPAAGFALAGIAFGVLSFADNLPERAYVFTYYMVWVNVVWNVFNLLPLWPLDGGRLFRLLALRLAKPWTAERVVFGLSIAIAAGIAYVGILYGYPFTVLIALLIGWQSVERWPLAGTGAAGLIRPRNTGARNRLAAADRALEQRDYAEAARVAHSVRQETHLDRATVERIFTVLAIASARLGAAEASAALGYAERARPGSAVDAARVLALCALGRVAEARAAATPAALAHLSHEERLEVGRALA